MKTKNNDFFVKNFQTRESLQRYKGIKAKITQLNVIILIILRKCSIQIIDNYKLLFLK